MMQEGIYEEYMKLRGQAQIEYASTGIKPEDATQSNEWNFYYRYYKVMFLEVMLLSHYTNIFDEEYN